MKWNALIAVMLFLGMVCGMHAAQPMTYKEISMLVRNGEQEQYIIDDATKRKLAQPLSPQEESDLTGMGASPALIKALRSVAMAATGSAPAAAPQNPPALQAEEPPSLPAMAPQAGDANRFVEGVKAAELAAPISLQAGDAFSISQLEQAKAKALKERKPLGFIMMWGQFYGQNVSNRSIGSAAAFVQFYQAFNDDLVLVFVRHETELNLVPPAVRKGFFGPDEGGFAPNMAVTDATASEFIVEIPMAGGDSVGDKRDGVFITAAAKIDQWMGAHPTGAAGK